MEIRTFFKLKIDIDELDTFYPNQQKCTKIYQTELIIDDKNNNEIQLKIFFDEKEYLGDKIMQWNHYYDFDLIENFRVIEVIEPKDLLEIDFLNYKCEGMENSTSFYEFNLKYFKIKLTGIKKAYNNSENSSS
ncbi:MAG: hypothetical protein KAJ23_15465, partial [Maribacter sp.]|nr:hypothetical protein [Maribacter sp.]